MKATGIVRKVDELGRIVLPIELRRTLGIDIKDGLEIFVEGEKVVLHKYQPACMFCDSIEGVTEFKGKKMCESCREEVSQLRP
ncbi:transcriptional pleiotropic regulator of transition state genes [Aneurinibacillus soli]|uniref:Transition state regulatory protein AbrB n=2 Tax=Aneurinibacillus soli TaxID=1500254 RepID=A0A0U4NIY3_9BACL|nr:transcriptional pleiotropic regulator of transition state genes [Aneurinibacillus soli]BAU28724.1 Transition state regulatory protein AbrB [Aneurinibacillus soli]